MRGKDVGRKGENRENKRERERGRKERERSRAEEKREQKSGLEQKRPNCSRFPKRVTDPTASDKGRVKRNDEDGDRRKKRKIGRSRARNWEHTPPGGGGPGKP